MIYPGKTRPYSLLSPFGVTRKGEAQYHVTREYRVAMGNRLLRSALSRDRETELHPQYDRYFRDFVKLLREGGGFLDAFRFEPSVPFTGFIDEIVEGFELLK
jgi:hypothetical protein